MAKKIRLVPAPHKRAMLETRMRYDVMLDDQCVDTLYFNMTGYCGGLPNPQGNTVSIGEASLSEYHREVARLNREFKLLEPSEVTS